MTLTLILLLAAFISPRIPLWYKVESPMKAKTGRFTPERTIPLAMGTEEPMQ